MRLGNSLTDASPAFPYQSSEATSKLGIPDAPVVHLAITELTERLLTHAVGAPEVINRNRQQALRVASGAVLFHWPFACVLAEFLYKIDLEPDFAASNAAEAAGIGTNWIGEAAMRLRAEGIEVPAQYRHHATAYGWQDLP